jgi:RHS repeat-associated protein
VTLPASGGTVSFKYDPFGRHIEKVSPTTTFFRGSNSFGYDGYGRRTGKTISSTTTNYLYDGANSVQELSGTTPTANILGGLGIDEVFTRTDSTATANFLKDALGSTIALTDPSVSSLATYAYEPFGNTTVTSGSSANSYEYTGRENDGTGLQFNRARYYSPTLQRFISEDPTGIAGGINVYAYAGNNPLSFTDPFGTDKKKDAPWRPTWIVCKAIDVISPSVSCTWNNGPHFQNRPLDSGQHLYPAYGGLNPPGSPVSDTGYVVAEDGTVIPVPQGYVGRVANNGQGLVYQDPASVGQGNANMVRIGDPDAQNPTGYVRIYNSQGQPIDPSTGAPGAPADTHIPLDYEGDIPLPLE